jgi:hypothetical protein
MIGTPAPEKQFVITLSGTLEFVTPDGEKFVVLTSPGGAHMWC